MNSRLEQDIQESKETGMNKSCLPTAARPNAAGIAHWCLQLADCWWSWESFTKHGESAANYNNKESAKEMQSMDL